MDDSFYQAHVHSGPHYCLGRKLHELCLHDILLMMLVKSPYGDVATANPIAARVSLGDIRVAVTICSTPYKTFARATSNRHLLPVLRNLWWKYRTEKKTREEAQAYLSQEAKRFDNYFEDYFSVPEMWNSDGEGSAIGAPWPLAVVASIMRNGKGAMTRKEIWTAPVGEMIWLNAALMEQAGATEIASAEQVEAMYELGLRKRPETKKAANHA